ncbi:enoyl-CoA hydratase/isomerase family protein [Myxococcota bacterium]|nr:enoyl-CoA hydratase/isomerase family protein [Myxococcota bacterium]
MDESLVLLERQGDVATLTLNDPERRNAMSRAMGEVFTRRIVQLRGEPGLRAVILTGAGRAFCAGGDMAMLEELAAQGADQGEQARNPIRDTMRSFYGLYLSIRELDCPTVASINGHAIGAGLCVALACDLRFVSSRARLGLNFTRLGLHPGMAATWTLPRLVGPARAAELLYTGRIIEAAEAEAMGLVNRAVEPAELATTVDSVAEAIAASAPQAVRATRRALARSLDVGLADQLAFEATEQGKGFTGPEVAEGLAAAREKRAPHFPKP